MEVVTLENAKLKKIIKKAFRNWTNAFKENFDETTTPASISLETLNILAACKDDVGFYLYDLIMNLREMGSGLDFYNLDGQDRLIVLDIYLFLLDRFRFEAMRRLGWLTNYPGRDTTIVEMVLCYEDIHRTMERSVPELSSDHSLYDEYISASDYEREGIVRRLIPELIRHIVGHKK